MISFHLVSTNYAVTCFVTTVPILGFREAETKYTCCDGTGSGCSISPYHVFEQNWEKNSGYMSTLSKPHMESNPGIYALDCEMCYTTAGIELTRVTVIKEDLSVAYETLVKPANKILDYNTRYLFPS